MGRRSSCRTSDSSPKYATRPLKLRSLSSYLTPVQVRFHAPMGRRGYVSKLGLMCSRWRRRGGEAEQKKIDERKFAFKLRPNIVIIANISRTSDGGRDGGEGRTHQSGVRKLESKGLPTDYPCARNSWMACQSFRVPLRSILFTHIAVSRTDDYEVL